ncbi:hypothetical protein [Rhodococcus sp. ZPP]|nr:hypothetical protein [Rhodococcus sp. ZPP]
MSMVPHVVAVVDADESDVAIWHVDTGPVRAQPDVWGVGAPQR